jgi:hypothetical protein
MYWVLLIVGLMITAAGFGTVGFGITEYAFSHGNTLIISGTTAVAAGLVLIGIATAVRQLQRIARALDVKPAPRVVRPAEPAEQPAAVAQPVAASVPPPAPAPAHAAPAPAHAAPAPPQPAAAPASLAPPTARMAPTPVRTGSQKAVEPATSRPDAPPAHAPEASGPLDWLRRPKAAPPAEPPVVEVTDEAPLSPRNPPRPTLPSTGEPTLEPRAWSPSRGNGVGEPQSSRAPAVRPDHIARAMPVPERPRDSGLFDVSWPDQRSAPPVTEPARREARPEAPAASPREEPRHAEAAPAPHVERAPAILKSGVIDGMAYTLYTDGSIEAELPQGTVRFASVDALRAHLEQHG